MRQISTGLKQPAGHLGQTLETESLVEIRCKEMDVSRNQAPKAKGPLKAMVKLEQLFCREQIRSVICYQKSISWKPGLYSMINIHIEILKISISNQHLTLSGKMWNLFTFIFLSRCVDRVKQMISNHFSPNSYIFLHWGSCCEYNNQIKVLCTYSTQQ